VWRRKTRGTRCCMMWHSSSSRASSRRLIIGCQSTAQQNHSLSQVLDTSMMVGRRWTTVNEEWRRRNKIGTKPEQQATQYKKVQSNVKKDVEGDKVKCSKVAQNKNRQLCPLLTHYLSPIHPSSVSSSAFSSLSHPHVTCCVIQGHNHWQL